MEVALANQALETSRRDIERLDAELKDYRGRAQVRPIIGLGPYKATAPTLFKLTIDPL